MNKRKQVNLKVLLLYLTAVLFTVYIFVMYFLVGAEHSPMVKAKLKNDHFSLTQWEWFFYPHIILGAISLLIGPFQSTKTSRKNPKLHRGLGKLYSGLIFINVLAVPYIAWFATGGFSSTVGFLVLDAFWLWTTAVGITRALQQKIQEHKIWMLRSYAITWVFVTFRILLIPLSLFLDQSVSFPLAVYISIALNLFVVEWKRKKRQKQVQHPTLLVL